MKRVINAIQHFETNGLIEQQLWPNHMSAFSTTSWATSVSKQKGRSSSSRSYCSSKDDSLIVFMHHAEWSHTRNPIVNPIQSCSTNF
jgi:hypothetical protein